MGTAPFPIDPVLTGIFIGYRNGRMIADEVMPRINPILERETFKYRKLTVAEGFTIPDTRVGRKSVPNEVEFTGTEVEGSTQDYGLDDVIPNADIDNAPPGFNPESHAVMKLADLLMLGREKRVADLAFTAATHPSGYKTTLSGTSQWSDYTNSNPIDAIMTALDLPLIRPNYMTVGRAVATKLSMHPKCVSAVFGNSGNVGVVRLEQIAAVLGLDGIFVGESWVNTAKPGQTASYARLWGKHALLHYRDSLANGNDGRATWGVTFQHGGKVAGRIDEPKVGLRGSVRIRTGESLAEKVIAPDLVYFFENAVA